MITAVDTNVLLDVFGADPLFARASSEALRRYLGEGGAGRFRGSMGRNGDRVWRRGSFALRSWLKFQREGGVLWRVCYVCLRLEL